MKIRTLISSQLSNKAMGKIPKALYQMKSKLKSTSNQLKRLSSRTIN